MGSVYMNGIHLWAGVTWSTLGFYHRSPQLIMLNFMCTATSAAALLVRLKWMLKRRADASSALAVVKEANSVTITSCSTVASTVATLTPGNITPRSKGSKGADLRHIDVVKEYCFFEIILGESSAIFLPVRSGKANDSVYTYDTVMSLLHARV